MNIKRLGVIAGSVLVAGALLTGAAFAAGGPSQLADHLAKAVQSGKLTQGQADAMTQLSNLRQQAMTKLKADEQAVIDQAVKDGKLTQEQAQKLAQREGHAGGQQGHFGKAGGPDKSGGRHFQHKPLTQDELKAKLDAAVKAGKLTQEKADQMLQKWANRGQETK